MLRHLYVFFFIFVKSNEIHGEKKSSMPMKKLRRNLMLIKEDCGDVCDTSDNFFKAPGIYFDQLTKNIQCEFLFESPIIESTTDVSEQQLNNAPPILDYLPKDVQQQYTYEGRIPLHYNYINDIDYLQNPAKKFKRKIYRDKMWEKKSIEVGQKLYRQNALFGGYGTEVVLNMTQLIKGYMIEQVIRVYLANLLNRN